MLQPVKSVSPVTITQGVEEGSSKRMEEDLFSLLLHVMLNFVCYLQALLPFFSQDHLNAVDVAVQPFPQKAHTGISKALGSSRDLILSGQIDS